MTSGEIEGVPRQLRRRSPSLVRVIAILGKGDFSLGRLSSEVAGFSRNDVLRAENEIRNKEHLVAARTSAPCEGPSFLVDACPRIVTPAYVKPRSHMRRGADILPESARFHASEELPFSSPTRRPPRTRV